MTSATLDSPWRTGSNQPGAGNQTLEQLRTQLRQMERPKPAGQTLSVHPALHSLLPGGLHPGCVYSVSNSTTVALLLLAGPARNGAWSGILGLPDLGMEAAAGLGLDPLRIIRVPDPGDSETIIAASLIDAFSIVLLAPKAPISAREATRLSARARERHSVIVSFGTHHWSGAQARLHLTHSSWSGADQGHGRLRSRSMTMSAELRSGDRRSTTLLMSDAGRIVSSERHPRLATVAL